MLTTSKPASPAFRKVPFPKVDLDVERRDDGSLLVSTRAELELIAPNVPVGLMRAAATWPDRVAMAERDANGVWLRKSYAEFVRDVRGCAQWLLDAGATSDTPLMIVSGNSIAHATMRFAALFAGIPIAPVSENYALLGTSNDYARLRHAAGIVRPGFVFAEGDLHVEAARACMPDAGIVSRKASDDEGVAAAFEDICTTPVTDAVDAAIDTIRPETHAAYMLTSGSTGMPKAVIQTHEMMMVCVSQSWWAMKDTGTWDRTILEWLPWSHVSGLYVSIAAALVGGSYHVDEGRPMPGRFEATLRNIRDLELTTFTSVPVGYAMLVEAMEQDEALRDHFFANMQVLVFGGAGLPQPIHDRLQALAVAATGHRILISSGYGATETTSGCMFIYFETDRVGIGLPLSGVTLKLVPMGDRYELRMKGPCVMQGYLRQPDAAAKSFDEEGFYSIGDAAELADPDDLTKGLLFGGRLSEDFKLSTGTWVTGGSLRANFVRDLAPYVADALVCGEGYDRIGILAWPSAEGLKASPEDLAAAISRHNASAKGSSEKVCRFAFLTDPPDMAAGEVSDKGSINQALAIRRRKETVEWLYSDPVPEGVLSF
jgi:feruloyl-CoA synthase